MTFARLIGAAALVWCVAALTASQSSPSYAQSFTQLPYSGVTDVLGPAFRVRNDDQDDLSSGIWAVGRVGVRGFSSSQTGVLGVGETTGVMGVGSGVGVAGVTKAGSSAVAGKFETVAAFDYRRLKKGETMSPTHGLLATSNSGVRGVVSSAVSASGVAGIYVDNVVDAQSAHAEYGMNRGFLGTKQTGVHGEAQAAKGFGVAGISLGGVDSVGVYGESGPGFAGFFRGRVTIRGNLLVEKLEAKEIYAAKGLVGQNAGKFFKIDHPLDPENQYLVHSSVESHEYKNFYDGVATLDANGAVTVTLPNWFEALNKDFRYQLTPIGAYAPLYIGQEIEQGRFQIAGGKPGMRVSWMVTGVRRDPYAAAHPVQVEQPKSASERGKYLAPREYGVSETRGIDYRQDQVVSLNSKPKGRTR